MTQFSPSHSLGFLLTDLSRLYRQAFERAVESAGLELTPGEIRALSHVALYDGSRQAVLAERMGVEPMTLSAYLDRLESHGLVQRQTDPTDRRAKVIRPTAKAENVFARIAPVTTDVFARITRGLDEAEVKTVADALTTMRANLAGDGSSPVSPSRGGVSALNGNA